jgi:hypothetical protein
MHESLFSNVTATDWAITLEKTQMSDLRQVQKDKYKQKTFRNIIEIAEVLSSFK